MLQQDLNFVIVFGLKVDGDFGPKTFSAVETYQGENRGCTRGVDGIAGHYTMSCLAAGSGHGSTVSDGHCVRHRAVLAW
jgi:peptidoglycan hydrolase-like protein with peptidoglycan-binding domain